MKRLAFITLVETSDHGDAERYWFIWNQHMLAPGFFGGSVDATDSSPRAAVLRELQEELGVAELFSRYKVALPGDPTLSDELASLVDSARECAVDQPWPIYSLRAAKEGKTANTVRSVSHYVARFAAIDYPALSAKLHTLSGLEIPASLRANDDSAKICSRFTADELIEHAPRWHYQPWIASALAFKAIELPATMLPWQSCALRTAEAMRARLQYYARLGGIRGHFAVRILPGYTPDEPHVDDIGSAAWLDIRHSAISRDPSEGIDDIAEPLIARLIAWSSDSIFQSTDSEGKTSLLVSIPRMVRRRGLYVRPESYPLDADEPVSDFVWPSLPSSVGVRTVLSDPPDIGLIKRFETDWLAWYQIVHTLFAERGTGNLVDESHLDSWRVLTISSRLLLALDHVAVALFLSQARWAERTQTEAAEHGDNFVLATDIRSLQTDKAPPDLKLAFIPNADTIAVDPARFAACLTDRHTSDGLARIATFMQLLDDLRPDNAHYLRAGNERVERLDALNQAEFASALCRVERYGYSGTGLDHLPASFRQLHPSHRGILCPFETPESKRVGLTVHFATTARIDPYGGLSAAGETDGELARSPATHLLPLIGHSDTTRTSMCAKNLKQATAIVGAEPPRLKSGTADAALAPIEGVLKRHDVHLPRDCGRNVIVAYMPWHGLNTDDAIVISQSARDAFAWKQARTLRFRVLPGWRMLTTTERSEQMSALTAQLATLHYEEAGHIKAGTIVTEGCELAWFKHSTGTIRPLLLRDIVNGTVNAVRWQPATGATWLGHTLEVDVEAHLPLLPGDKLMGRYGNKGVIARIVADEDMPLIPNTDAVPQPLRGRRVEVLLNPLGVITRLNLGQVFETHLTWAQAFDEKRGSAAVLAAGAVLTDEQRDAIQQHPMVKLSIPDYGTDTSAPIATTYPVTVGWQYLFRLKQSPSLKGHFRGKGTVSGGGYAALTGQPTRGRSQRGGQSFGEMELWALVAHGSDHLLADVIGPRSAPPGAGSGINPTWTSICAHLRALGIDVERDHRGVCAKRITRPSTGDEWSGDHSWAASRWRCNHCRSVYEAPDRRAVSVATTERGGEYAPLYGWLTVVAPELLPIVSALPFVAVAQGELDTPISVASFRWRMTLCSTHAGNGRERLLPLTLIFERQGDAAAAPNDLNKEFVFRLPRPSAKLNWKTGFAWCCAIHPTQPQARLAPVDVQAAQDRNVQWIALTAVSPADPAAHGGIDVPVLPAMYRPSGHDGSPAPLTTAYHALLNAAHRPGGDARKQQIRWQLAVIQALLWHRLTGNLRHPGSLQPLNSADSQPDGVSAAETRVAHQRMARHLRQRFGLTERSPKFGLLRGAGLRRRVDWSGRFVIIPRPDLPVDHCAVPAAALAVLLGETIAEWIQTPVAMASITDIAAESSADVRKPEYWLGRTFLSTPAVVEGVSDARWATLRASKAIIDAYLGAHPDTYVLLNRQPSLHKHSLLAFRPISAELGEGWTLGIHPLVCKGFNADFDGDEMTIHAVLTPEQRAEAAHLLPTHATQLTMAANPSNPLWECKQDFALGAWLARVNADDALQALARAANAEVCHRAGQQTPSATTSDVVALLNATYQQALRTATQAGVSFSAIELLRLDAKAVACHPTRDGDEAAAYAGNQTDGVSARKQLDDDKDVAPNLYALFTSKARGKVEQHGRQMYVARGYLDPNELTRGETKALGRDLKTVQIGRHHCPVSLTRGQSADQLFYAAFAGRSALVDKKLLTPTAGALTRRMMLAAWEWCIFGDDCHAPSPQSAISCQQSARTGRHKVICRACYGAGAHLADGAPIGVLAAQSVGERGTQLSMESYKGDGRRVRPSNVAHLLTVLQQMAKCVASNLSATAPTQKKTDTVRALAKYAREGASASGVWTEVVQRHLDAWLNQTTVPSCEQCATFAQTWFVLAINSIDVYQALARWHVPLIARVVFDAASTSGGWLTEWLHGNDRIARSPHTRWREILDDPNQFAEPLDSWIAQLLRGELSPPSAIVRQEASTIEIESIRPDA